MEGRKAVRIHASHGFAVSALRDLLAREDQTCRWTSATWATSIRRPRWRMAAVIWPACTCPRGELRAGSMAPWREVLSPPSTA